MNIRTVFMFLVCFLGILSFSHGLEKDTVELTEFIKEYRFVYSLPHSSTSKAITDTLGQFTNLRTVDKIKGYIQIVSTAQSVDYYGSWMSLIISAHDILPSLIFVFRTLDADHDLSFDRKLDLTCSIVNEFLAIHQVGKIEERILITSTLEHIIVSTLANNYMALSDGIIAAQMVIDKINNPSVQNKNFSFDYYMTVYERYRESGIELISPSDTKQYPYLR